MTGPEQVLDDDLADEMRGHVRGFLDALVVVLPGTLPAGLSEPYFHERRDAHTDRLHRYPILDFWADTGTAAPATVTAAEVRATEDWEASDPRRARWVVVSSAMTLGESLRGYWLLEDSDTGEDS